MIRSLATSPDAQFAAVRIGREVSLLAAGAGPPLAKIELDSDDVDITLVGPPTAMLAVSRSDNGHKIVLYQPPYLEAVARQDLEIPAKLVAATGPRIAVISADAMHAMVVRASNRALATQKVEVTGPIEFVVGLERNQLLFGLHKKLEVWDAVSGRPLLRPNFQLPPSPRTLGPAHGHLWAMRTGSEEIFVYRLSDGRPFRHHAGAPILEVICHPASPLIVLRTERSLYRLHCFSHSMSTIDQLPGEATAFALLAVGDDVTLLGLPEDGTVPWRMVLSGGGAPMVTMQMDTAEPPASMQAPRATEVSEPVVAPAVEPHAGGKMWRQQLATLGAELVRGGEVELPVVAIDNVLGDLAHRLQLSSAARRTLIALYSLHLVGEPSLPIAKLAAVVNDWPEALGQGDLGQLAMVKTKHGRVSLRRAVTDLLDGVPPRSIRIVGGGPTTPRAGVWRAARDGRPDIEIEPALADQLGRIAVVEGLLARAVLEARLHGATAVATSVPAERPRPWPRDAGLVFVLYGTSSSWVADVPALT
jgi:hypothetical protein